MAPNVRLITHPAQRTNGAPSGHLEANERAWRELVANQCNSSQPFGSRDLAVARTFLDPLGWLPWSRIRHVLCVASAGGQQAPSFAAMGCQVTLLDLSAEQLALDQQVAERNGFELEIIQGNMVDLSCLHGRDFDLVYQAISALYIPDVERLYREISRVLRPGGSYRVEHLSPLHVQIDEDCSWDGEGYRIVRPQGTGEAVEQSWWFRNGDGDLVSVQLEHFAHTLDQMIGGLTRAGFDIVKFGERTVGDPADLPGSYAHLYSYLPPYLMMLARRRSRR